MLTQSYLIYLVLSITIAIWVGRTLSRNGRVFLVENFEGNEQLADSVNHLLLVGFYLINFGFISLALKYGDKPETIHHVIEFLSTKIGMVIMLLGAMHFFNMRALIKFRHFKWMAKSDGNKEQFNE